MDPASILEGLDRAVKLGIAAYEVYARFKEAFDRGADHVDFSGVVSGSSTTAPRYPDQVSYEPRRARHGPRCGCLACLRRFAQADQLDDDVVALLR